MNDVVGPEAEIAFQMTITRAANGKVEVYDMVGHVQQSQPKEKDDGGNSHSSSTERSD